MKIKWLVVLFIFFLGVIFLSLLFTQQSQKSVSLFSIAEQAESRISPTYLSQVRPALISTLPLEKSGVTIIKAPVIALEEINIRAPKIVDKAMNNVASQNVALSIGIKDSLPVGITKIGKQPTPKEAQKINSTGIVLY